MKIISLKEANERMRWHPEESHLCYDLGENRCYDPYAQGYAYHRLFASHRLYWPEVESLYEADRRVKELGVEEYQRWEQYNPTLEIEVHLVPYPFAPHANCLEVQPNIMLWLPSFLSWSQSKVAEIYAHEFYHFYQHTVGRDKALKDTTYDYAGDPLEIEAREFGLRVCEQDAASQQRVP